MADDKYRSSVGQGRVMELEGTLMEHDKPIVDFKNQYSQAINKHQNAT